MDNNKFVLEVTRNQLALINEAVEYLGRHMIWQHNFKPIALQERMKESASKDWYTLLDMWKVIMHHFAKWWPSINIHSYEVLKMWKEPLMTLKILDEAE